MEPFDLQNVRHLARQLGIDADLMHKWAQKRQSLVERNGLQAAAAGEIRLFGPIVDDIEQAFVDDWYGEGLVMSGSEFKKQIDAISGDVLIRINSPGGDVWATASIVNSMVEKQKASAVNVMVEGLAASAATMVMISGDRVEIAPLSDVMIHQTSAFQYGTADDFRKLAQLLEDKDSGVAALYAKRTGKTADEMFALMKEETWFTPEQAVEMGLADAVVEPENKDKKKDKQKNNADEQAALNQRRQRFAALFHYDADTE